MIPKRQDEKTAAPGHLFGDACDKRKVRQSQKSLSESNVTRSPGTVNNRKSWAYAKSTQIPESRDIPATSKRWADLRKRRGFSSAFARLFPCKRLMIREL
jgi:hypothetical protein